MPKILVVDDEEDLVRYVRLRLEREGWEAVTAYNGQEAQEAVIDYRPDLVTLDVMMPVMDGWGFLEWMRGDPLHCKTPVVMLTAKGTTSDLEKARALYVQSYVIKPFDCERLVEIVRKVLKLT